MLKARYLAAGFFLTLAGTAGPAAAQRPVVVELFTSEGCSSCPPADALLAELALRPDVLALSFHIDYWDRLGWKDPFSSSAATLRQQHYAGLFDTGSVYTPQIVVDGHWQAVGSDRDAVERAITAAEGAPSAIPVTLSVDRARARVTLGPGGERVRGSVVLVAFDRRHVDAVARGENSGRTLTHVDVVRGLAEAGPLDSRTRAIEAAIPAPADRLAAILQSDDGRILGAAVADLPQR
ncbi:MAG: DUF1223 domain-containing protein [Stellaceae bacterium]